METVNLIWSKGFSDAIESIRATLYGYPNEDGDIYIMREVDRIQGEGRAAGYADGHEKGFALGHEEGYQEGYADGLQKGIYG